MGKILIGIPGNLRRVELTETTLIGRHWLCSAVLSNIDVPLYWLEVRWISDHWGWRCLSGAEKTKGAGTATNNGWRSWKSRASIPPVISLTNGVTIELVDSSPPAFHLQDVYTGEQYTGDALLELIELTEGGYTLQNGGGDRDPDSTFLQDGALLQTKGKVLRVWRPTGWQPTRTPHVSLSVAGLYLTIDSDKLTATLTQREAEVTIKGAPVKLLLTYAQAVVDGQWIESESYLTTEAAYKGWVQNGGPTDSEPKRLSWERGKLRSMLVGAGVVGVDELFDRRRDGVAWSHRLNVAPALITII